MTTLLIAVLAGIGFLVAYYTYGRWLGRKIFRLAADRVCPSESLRDDVDFVPTKRGVIFGHHFTSIAGTGPIVGPAIAVMWGWVPALLWVVLGSIFIGAVHDFGALSPPPGAEAPPKKAAPIKPRTINAKAEINCRELM